MERWGTESELGLEAFVKLMGFCLVLFLAVWGMVRDVEGIGLQARRNPPLGLFSGILPR